MPGQRGSEKRDRQHIVRVRMNDAELATLDRKIGKSAWSRAEFLRKVVQMSGTASVVDTAPIIAQLSKIGSNLNQIAHKLNRFELDVDTALLEQELGRLKATIQHLAAL